MPESHIVSESRLVEHLESLLGPIDAGWQNDKSKSGIAVARFRDQPWEDVSTFATLGLSNHVLPMGAERDVRQELVFVAEGGFADAAIASFLQTFAEFVVDHHRALLRGDVIGPSKPIVPETHMNAIYAAIPVLHDERLQTFDGTRPPTVLVWVVPLHAAEAIFVRKHGWEAFEDRLEAADPNLSDLQRGPAV